MDSISEPTTEQSNTTRQNTKSGQEVAKPKPLRRPPSRTHKDFWKQRLERRCYSKNGELREVEEWSVRIQHLGKRKSFALGTTSAEVAAIKARDLYLKVVAEGWQAAEIAYNPEMIVRKDDPTLGSFLEAVEQHSTLKPKTFRNYSGYFRRIVGDLFNIRGSKFDYRRGGNEEWRKSIDRIRLAEITPEKIEQWRRAHVVAASANSLRRESAIRSANSYLRCARALFSRKWLKHIEKVLRLPDTLPFEGVTISSSRPRRYKSGVDLPKLMSAARSEFFERKSPVYLVFILAIGAGLRKGEIDGLEWRHINFEDASIDVQPTEHRGLKTESSCAVVQIDPELRDELKLFQNTAKSEFVIEGTGKIKLNSGIQQYRAEKVFAELYSWLRAQGIKDQKPLHLLRKEFGSQINVRFGLFATMTALRHNNVTTTANHYVENMKRIALPFREIIKKTFNQPPC